MTLTNKDEEHFKLATVCHICKNGFTKKDYKVRDHCHVTEKYREAAHSNCNPESCCVRPTSNLFINVMH